jgi:hypothetical protein
VPVRGDSLFREQPAARAAAGDRPGHDANGIVLMRTGARDHRNDENEDLGLLAYTSHPGIFYPPVKLA